MSGTAVKLGLAAALAAANLFPAAGATRGLLVHPGEFSAKWIERARMTGVDTLALHPEGGPHSFTSLTNLLSQMRTDGFRALVDRAIDAGLRIEYEFHAGGYLLPRELFAGHPEYFRLDEKGVRNPDFDFCVANPEALAIVAARARQLVDSLYRSTDRYYFWLDDTDAGGCRCPGCAALTPSDRQLKALNAMIREMRKSNPRATLAYLAYRSTLERPRTVKPEDGIFLEYAPIERVWDKPVSAQNIADPARLGELIAYFGGKGAKVLEYWYDNSLFSQWTKPARLFRPANAVVRDDLAYYGRIGFADIASFACYLGDDYEAAWGEPDLSAFAPDGIVCRGFWGEARKRDQTTFECRADADRVYFSFNVWDDNVTAAPVGEPERTLESYDRVEVFFAATADLSKPYCGIEIDPCGRVLDYRGNYGKGLDYSWNVRTLKVSTRIVEGGYLVKGSIAITELAEFEIDLRNCWFGAFRADYAPGGRLIDWYSFRPSDGRPANFHQPNMFAPVALRP